MTAPTLDEAINRRTAVILEHYLEQVHKLGAELSVSNLLVGANDAVKALAAASTSRRTASTKSSRLERVPAKRCRCAAQRSRTRIPKRSSPT